MAISKKNVFSVVGRYRDEAGEPRGDLVNLVVCSVDPAAVRLLMEQTAPNFAVLNVTGLVDMEEMVKKLLALVSGKDKSWQVVVDPVLIMG